MRAGRTKKLSLGEVHASGFKYRRIGQDNFYRFGEGGVKAASLEDAVAMDYEIEPRPQVTDIWHIPLSATVDYRKLTKDDERAEVFIKVVRKQNPDGTAMFSAVAQEPEQKKEKPKVRNKTRGKKSNGK